MSEEHALVVQRVVQVHMPPEHEQAARAADVAALPPGVEHPAACDAVFANPPDTVGSDAKATADTAVPTKEERQAEAAMILLFAQQLALTHAKQERRLPEAPERPRRQDEEDSPDA